MTEEAKIAAKISKAKRSKHPEEMRRGISIRLKVVLTLLSGLVIAAVATMITQQVYVDSTKQRVETMAALLNAERVQSIIDQGSQSKADEAFLKEKLAAARKVNSSARFVYLMAKNDQKGVYFLVDSEPVGSEGYSPYGQEYTEASDALKATFTNGQTLIEGPSSDRWGTWLSVLAPVYDDGGREIAVLGMDIPASTYISLLVATAIGPILLAILILVVFYGVDANRRHKKAALKMRSELVSIASHELRTPLTGIRWGEEILMNEVTAEKGVQIVRSMYDSTLRLQESIEDILQLANLQSGRADELNKAVTDITEQLNGIMITQKLPAAQRGITMKFTDDFPEHLMINVDSQRMKRVFNNIMSNAIKYTRDNTTITIGYDIKDGKHLISIADQGIGIPEAEQAKVFEGFYRASNVISHEINGTGMGLYMSRSAVEQHGGRLWLDSRENEGTTVYIELP